MKTFETIHFDPTRGRQELLDLRDHLASRRPLKERGDILGFFRARPHLSALCGRYHTRIAHPDLIAWEYDIFGDFACDLAVGDAARKTYAFVEFEDAGPRSLFVKQGRKVTREWSARFEHGFGQVIDWFYKLDDRRNSDECEARFGKRSIDFVGLLVIGRDHDMDAGERLHLEWRRQHVIVHSRRIDCVTYDELLADLLARLEIDARMSRRKNARDRRR